MGQEQIGSRPQPCDRCFAATGGSAEESLRKVGVAGIVTLQDTRGCDTLFQPDSSLDASGMWPVFSSANTPERPGEELPVQELMTYPI